MEKTSLDGQVTVSRRSPAQGRFRTSPRNQPYRSGIHPHPRLVRPRGILRNQAGQLPGQAHEVLRGRLERRQEQGAEGGRSIRGEGLEGPAQAGREAEGKAQEEEVGG